MVMLLDAPLGRTERGFHLVGMCLNLGSNNIGHVLFSQSSRSLHWATRSGLWVCLVLLHFFALFCRETMHSVAFMNSENCRERFES
jgi:hypothetical protein